jgi:enolase
MTEIVDIIAREILDSRGNPTVEVDVILDDGAFGRAAVPSGASTGAHEANENCATATRPLPGKGVLKAVDAVNGEIFDAILGRGRRGPARIDNGADRTGRHAEQEPARRQRHSRRLSLAVAKAAAERAACRSTSMSAASRRVLPTPMMNIINGGEHADNPIDIQEFMIMPTGADSFAEGCAWGRRSSTR